MDLSIIKEKLHTLQYASAVDFVKDIRLMLSNCARYNQVRINSFGVMRNKFNPFSSTHLYTWAARGTVVKCLTQRRNVTVPSSNPDLLIRNPACWLLDKRTSSTAEISVPNWTWSSWISVILHCCWPVAVCSSLERGQVLASFKIPSCQVQLLLSMLIHPTPREHRCLTNY